MSKSIEFTASQIKAYENGATVFMFAITSETFINSESGTGNTIDLFLIQKGDKDIFITEKKFKCTHCKKEQIVTELDERISTQECPYCGYRNKVIADSFKECIYARAVRVNDIHIYYISKMGYDFRKTTNMETEHSWLEKTYNKQMQEQNINRTYEGSDYVFIAEFKR